MNKTYTLENACEMVRDLVETWDRISEYKVEKLIFPPYQDVSANSLSEMTAVCLKIINEENGEVKIEKAPMVIDGVEMPSPISVEPEEGGMVYYVGENGKVHSASYYRCSEGRANQFNHGMLYSNVIDALAFRNAIYPKFKGED